MYKAYLNELELPMLEVPFIEDQRENATDNESLTGRMWTDFNNRIREWNINYSFLKRDTYFGIKDIYERQFTHNSVPLLTVEGEGIENRPVRMYMNPRDIRIHGKYAYNVRMEFVERVAIGDTLDEES